MYRYMCMYVYSCSCMWVYKYFNRRKDKIGYVVVRDDFCKGEVIYVVVYFLCL